MAYFANPSGTTFARRESSFFYLNYLSYEKNLDVEHQEYDPHSRLTHFHFAIIEQIGFGHFAIAEQIYKELILKKREFFPTGYFFKEEVIDLLEEIVFSLKEKGLKASMLDFQLFLHINSNS